MPILSLSRTWGRHAQEFCYQMTQKKTVVPIVRGSHIAVAVIYVLMYLRLCFVIFLFYV